MRFLGSTCADDYLISWEIKILRLSCFFFFPSEILDVKESESFVEKFQTSNHKIEGNASCVSWAEQGIRKWETQSKHFTQLCGKCLWISFAFVADYLASWITMNCINVATVRAELEFQGATREHKRRFLGEGWQIKWEQNPKALL